MGAELLEALKEALKFVLVRAGEPGRRNCRISTVMSARLRRAGRVAPLFAALGDEIRLGLVARLSAGRPVSVTQLTEGSGVTRQAVSKHLRVLAGAGLVRGARRGRESL